MKFLVLCVVLSAATIYCKGAPTNQAADGPHDERWRLVSGYETAYEYTNQLACGKEPLLNVTGELAEILTGICELLEVQKLSAKVYNGSDLNAILEQNIMDVCKWLNLLVEMNDTALAVSQRFTEINATCETGHTPRLSQYCLETKMEAFYRDIYRPASNYYADTVVSQDIPIWLEFSNITAKVAESIKITITAPCVN